MNRTETEDGSYASARNRKRLAEWAAKAGENEYADPALNPCRTTAFEFFTDDEQAGCQIRPPMVHCEPAAERQELGHKNRPKNPECIHVQLTAAGRERQEQGQQKGSDNDRGTSQDQHQSRRHRDITSGQGR